MLALAIKYDQAELFDEAWDVLAPILDEADASPEALLLGARLRYRAGDFRAALALLDRLLATEPGQADAALLRGVVLRSLGAPAEAAAVFRALLTGRPSPEAWNNLGLVLEDQGAMAEARDAYEQALALQPGFAAAGANLGGLMLRHGLFASAARACGAALAVTPDDAPAGINLGVALLEQGYHDEAGAAFARVLTHAPQDRNAADNSLYLLHYTSNDPAAVMAAHKAWGDGFAGSARVTRSPGPRLRVGYVSPDFRRHSVSYFVEPLLAAHNPAAIETFCYADGGPADAVTARLRAAAHHWRDLRRCSDEALCGQIHDDRIDILVDLAGHTTGNRLGAFARRPSPVQVSALGYPGTTGLQAMDFRFCDAITDPPASDGFATERLVRLPVMHCYRPPADAPVPTSPPGSGSGAMTFGSFNKLGKVTDRTISLWSAVLKALPDARLLLKSKTLAEDETRAFTAARFAAAGISPDRIVMAGWLPDDAGHLGAYAGVDIALDTFPYSGTTTTCEALWMGVPVLTLPGATHASRVSASLLTAVGLTDWIVSSPAAFAARAVAAAGDRPGLAALRTTLRPRMATSPLCDARTYATAVEAAYRRMAKAV